MRLHGQSGALARPQGRRGARRAAAAGMLDTGEMTVGIMAVLVRHER